MFKRTDQEKFKDLYGQYHVLVRNVLYNMIGKEALDDVTQETFIRIWNGLPNFAFRSSLKTWIYRITINTATDHLRRRKMVPQELLENEKERRELQNSSSESQLVESFLEELDENSREIIVLFYFEELPVKKIAKILEIPEGTVKSRLHHAKGKVKKYLSSKGVNL